jgi:hypothetical protein
MPSRVLGFKLKAGVSYLAERRSAYGCRPTSAGLEGAGAKQWGGVLAGAPHWSPRLARVLPVWVLMQERRKRAQGRVSLTHFDAPGAAVRIVLTHCFAPAIPKRGARRFGFVQTRLVSARDGKRNDCL